VPGTSKIRSRVLTTHSDVTFSVNLRYRGESRYTWFRCPHFRISVVLFQYHEEHQYPSRGQNLKPITCVDPSPGLSGNVMQMIGLVLMNYEASLTSK
jgi:hypothetical protein